MANRRLGKESFDQKICEKYHENLESLDFKTTKDPVTIRCKDCGYTQSFTKAANFLYCASSERGGFCPNCRKMHPYNSWTHEDFLQHVKERNDNADNFIFLNKYENRDTIMQCQCKKCGAIFQRYARGFLLNRPCP